VSASGTNHPAVEHSGRSQVRICPGNTPATAVAAHPCLACGWYAHLTNLTNPTNPTNPTNLTNPTNPTNL